MHILNAFGLTVRSPFSWLEMFLSRLHHRLIARINATKKNQEEKLKMKAEVAERIEKLRNNTEEVSFIFLILKGGGWGGAHNTEFELIVR